MERYTLRFCAYEKVQSLLSAKVLSVLVIDPFNKIRDVDSQDLEDVNRYTMEYLKQRLKSFAKKFDVLSICM